MKTNYKQIKFTGDIFRVSYHQRPTQDGNIKWLYHALKNPLQLATSLPVETELFSKQDISLVSSGYRMIGEDISMEGWPKLFYHNDFSEEFLQQVWLNFKNSIVIAFELPELLKSALDSLNIPFVDIIIHPVRFLDDLVFGIRSNNREISQLLQNYLIPEESILIQAGIVMASMNRLKRLDITGKAALFAGQTTDDKVLIDEGKFHKVSNFLDKFSEISNSYDTLIIKSHPYSADPFEAISISRLFNNCITVTDNFYYLMSHENIEAVYSISSSTSIEARYLGKEGYHLAKYPFRFTEDFNEGEFQLGSFFTIDDAIFSADFWRTILAPLVITTPITDVKIPKKPNRIRTSLRSFWGFNFVDTDIICQIYKQ
ncbi:MAG: hypothetical protein HC939_07280 [Pleurocapsa sp. SU_5_0]|nr:hypothetical protein [Pleurocapsa sp. SU_5_0]NJR44963.1 hypothetical protein [Hyellaceae cyanobacterium CSU_1_1]